MEFRAKVELDMLLILIEVHSLSLIPNKLCSRVVGGNVRKAVPLLFPSFEKAEGTTHLTTFNVGSFSP